MNITIIIEGNTGLNLTVKDEWEHISKDNLRFLVDRIAKFYFLDAHSPSDFDVINWDSNDSSN